VKHSGFAIAMCALASVAGCGRADANATGPNGACSATELAIAVTVRDSVSGRPVADGASGTWQNTTDTLSNAMAIDTLFHLDSLTLLVGGSGLGTYDVTVTRAGYRPWTRTGVQVNQTGGPCRSIVTVNLTAALQLTAAAPSATERVRAAR
jgi:hypothetical protein